MRDENGQPVASQAECVRYAGQGGVPQPAEMIFAIACSNLNGTPGYQAGTSDVLVSKLVDGNGNGVLDAGDLIIMGRYPTNRAASNFANWGVTQHAVARLPNFGNAQNLHVDDTDGCRHHWGNDAFDHYQETNPEFDPDPSLGCPYGLPEEDVQSSIADCTPPLSRNDSIHVNASVSQPSQAVYVDGPFEQPGVDNNFIDVDIY